MRSLVQFQINEGQGLASFSLGAVLNTISNLYEMYCLETTGSEVDLGDRDVLFATLQCSTHVVAHYFDLRTTYFNKVMAPLFEEKSF